MQLQAPPSLVNRRGRVLRCQADTAWLGSRFAAGVEQSAQEQRMVALKEELFLESRALQADEARTTGTPVPDSVEGELSRRVRTACAALSQGLVSRDGEVRLLLIAALSGEHLLLLGPPGTAKSELGRRLSALVGGAFFERLLTKFSVPEEVFGPLSLRALEQDKYLRQTEGYLPTASVAFLDEVFKANSAVLNSLLTIMNERLFDNGATRSPVPLLCLVGASNELPESEELDALYDRFLLRKEVQQVSDALLPELLLGNLHAAPVDALFSAPELRAIHHAALAVQLPEAVRELLTDVRSWAQAQGGWYISDRRMAHAANLLRVAAHVAGRSRVAVHDCLLLSHVLWREPGQESGLRSWLLEACHRRLLDGYDVSEQLSTAFADLCRSSCLEEAPSDGVLLAKLETLRVRLRAAALSAAELKRMDCVEIATSLWMTPLEASAASASLRSAATVASEKAQQQLELVWNVQRGMYIRKMAPLSDAAWFSHCARLSHRAQPADHHAAAPSPHLALTVTRLATTCTLSE